MKTVQKSEPGYVFPCPTCVPETDQPALQHLQGVEGGTPILIGWHPLDAPNPLPATAD